MHITVDVIRIYSFGLAHKHVHSSGVTDDAATLIHSLVLFLGLATFVKLFHTNLPESTTFALIDVSCVIRIRSCPMWVPCQKLT